ncbi:DPP IV N-terminal domain-containing protein [Paucibacter sp. B2R-40]|uniref:TolB family protein n=1 Tax=Paucibacter sp. B2R-40 TaxID=2893554 RepID=UPI0021E44EED|nr:DPP IV N-terminal domain-containing protein [Paucibacter sp. B2R-40]MCV2353192.1 DPP IV N-terminal domain-containing protein [Paucibacter sp. B2R-40]
MRLFSPVCGLLNPLLRSPSSPYGIAFVQQAHRSTTESWLKKWSEFMSLKSKLSAAVAVTSSRSTLCSGFEPNRPGAGVLLVIGGLARRLLWCLLPLAAAATAQASDIVFTSNREGGIFQLYRMAEDGSSVKRATAEAMEAQQFDLSPDRKKAVFVSVRAGQPDLYIADLRTGQVTQLTNDAAMEATPIWSPDGKSVAYQSYLSRRPALYIINVDGTGHRKLTDEKGEESMPAFSPDGRKLAYVVTMGRRQAQIRTVDLESGKSTVIGAEPSVGLESGPRWSPDGSHLVYVMLKDDVTHIYTMRADGSERRALTTGEDKNNEPNWSVDGRQIVFLSIRKPSNRQAIYAMSEDGSRQRELVGGPEEHMLARWTPDHRSLYFMRFHRGAGQIFVASADGSDIRKVSSGSGYDAEFAFVSDANKAPTFAAR